MHTTSLTVRFNELDPYGHVNHAYYLTYFEHARIEALAAAGLPLTGMQEQGFLFVVAEATVRFHRPALLGHVLTVETRLAKAGQVSARWAQRLARDGETVATLDLRTGIVGPDGKPRKAPASILEALDVLSTP